MMTDGTITLRAPEPSDVDAMFRWENDRTIWPDGRSRAPLSRHRLWQYVESYSADPLAEGELRLMIADNCTGEAVGCVDLYDVDAVNRRAGIGIVIDPAWRGRGYALKTLALIADYCRNDLGLHQLWAVAGAANEASRTLFERGGFTVAGRLRSWIRISGTSYGDAYIYQRLLP